jgi:outer membrane protein TolC
MANKAILAIIFAAALPAGALFGQDTMKSMTLEECLIRAMEQNLGLQVQVQNPELADLRVSQAGEIFLPSMSFDYANQDNRSAATSFLDSLGGIRITKQNSYGVGLSQLLPTGGRLQARVSTGMYDSNERYQTVNPYFSGNLSFTFIQPLLRDFGFNINRREIIVARNNRGIAEATYKMALLTMLYDVEEAYWNLVYSIENYEVMQGSLQLAKNLLERNKRETEIGMMAPIEVLSAQSEVAAREADMLQAEVLIKNRRDALQTLLNMGSAGGENEAQIRPIDVPVVGTSQISMESALALARAGRPELASAELDIKNKDLDLTYARNQLLPEVNLTAQYWSPASSGTQILYKDDNPLTGVIIGSIPGGSRQAIQDALKFKYKNWYLALNVTMPLNFVFSRAAAAQAKVNLTQSKIMLADREQQIFLEVRNAVRDVENNAKRVEAYKVARELAEQKLAAEERKAKVGLSTNYTVLQVQRDLATARSRELQARIDDVLSRARLDKATGTSPEKRNIKWAGSDRN